MPAPTALATKLSMAFAAQALRRTISRERDRKASPPTVSRALRPSAEAYQPRVRQPAEAAS
jgi:hypothetical protein